MSTEVSRLYNFVDDKNNGVPITASRMDAEFNQDITALNQKVIIKSSAPSSPINGMLWLDSTLKLLKQYRNSEWIVMGVVHVSSTAMSTAQAGDVWVDTSGSETIYKFRNKANTAWITVSDSNSNNPPTGAVIDWTSKTAPSGWLICDGSAVSRSTYSALFAVIAPDLGNFTVTIASPAVLTLNSHGLVAGDAVYFTTTGALPTGLSSNTIYYVISAGLTSNAFEVSTSRGGSAVNTSGTQSGTHSCRFCPFGLGDGSTTFNLPNPKGSVLVAYDTSQTEFAYIGQTGGEKTHTLTIPEMPAHTHTSPLASPNTGGSSGVPQNTPGPADTTSNVSNSTGGGGAHNNLQPYIVIGPKIIKT